MPNLQNLISVQELNSRRTPEQHSADSRKAGLASGEARRRRKALKEELLLLLEEGKVQEKVAVALINKATDGDVRAFEVLRDTIGEKPVDRQEVKQVNTDWFIDEETE